MLIQELLGHRQITSTQVYVQPGAAALRAAVERAYARTQAIAGAVARGGGERWRALSLRRSFRCGSPVAGEDELSRLRRAVDLPRLIEAGYDPGAHVIRPAPDHPVLGYRAVSGGGLHGGGGGGRAVRRLPAALPRFDGTLEEFVAIPRVFTLVRARRAAPVPGVPHAGPRAAGRGRDGLCMQLQSGAQDARPDG